MTQEQEIKLLKTILEGDFEENKKAFSELIRVYNKKLTQEQADNMYTEGVLYGVNYLYDSVKVFAFQLLVELGVYKKTDSYTIKTKKIEGYSDTGRIESIIKKADGKRGKYVYARHYQNGNIVSPMHNYHKMGKYANTDTIICKMLYSQRRKYLKSIP